VKRKDRTRSTPPGLQLPGPTSPGRPSTSAGNHRRQSPPARRPAGLDAHLPPDEELLARFGDAIDDRIAEIVDELIEERNSARQHRFGRYIGAVSLSGAREARDLSDRIDNFVGATIVQELDRPSRAR
jgi:hypothetical protein